MKNKPKYKIDNSKLTRLAAKAQKGDSRATGEVADMISGYLYYYSLTTLGNEEKARDAVQDILLTMLKKMDTLENPKCFLGWIKAITANYCHSKITREHESLSFDEALEKWEDDDVQVCPSRYAETNELRAAVRSAVSELPENQRESVMMFYFQQLSVKQIAETLSVNENTVKSRLFSARQSLKKRLEACALASFGAAPMKLISYSLITEAESQRNLIIPFATPKGSVMVATANTAAASGVPLKIAAAACAVLVTAGAGVSAATANYSNKPSQKQYVSAAKQSRSAVQTVSEPSSAADSTKASFTIAPAFDEVQPVAEVRQNFVSEPNVPVVRQNNTDKTPHAATAPAAKVRTATEPPETKPQETTPSPTVQATTRAAEKKIYVDTSEWADTTNVFCHIYEPGGSEFFSFGSQKEYCTVYSESVYVYDLSALNLKDNTIYKVMFGSQLGSNTTELEFTTAHYSDVVKTEKDPYKAPSDSKNQTYIASWK